MSMLKYFKLKEDIDAFKQSEDAKAKVVSGGKVLAKGIANFGIYMVTDFSTDYAKQVLKSDVASEAQKETARRILEKKSSNSSNKE